MENQVELLKKIARLESMNDQLMSEIAFIDELMKSVGFEGGIETVKATAQEVIRRGDSLDEAA